MFSVLVSYGIGFLDSYLQHYRLLLSFAGLLQVHTPFLIDTALANDPIENIIVNNLFGMSTGLGLLPVTFDWSQIAYNGSPLVVPFWAQANVFAGWAFFFALVTPILYYTNTWSVSSPWKQDIHVSKAHESLGIHPTFLLADPTATIIQPACTIFRKSSMPMATSSPPLMKLTAQFSCL